MGDVHRLIAFDLDGTLIDSRRDLASSANALIVERGGRALPESDIARMVGDGATMLVRRALTAAGLPFDEASVERFLEIYDGRLLDTTRAYAGISAAVEALAADETLVVLTNKPLAHSQRILEGLGLARHFAAVVGGDNPLGRKPDPASLQALMDRFGATAETTVLIGDSRVDHETARRAGVRVCLARYGFGYETFPVSELRGDEVLVDDASQLVPAIRSLLDRNGAVTNDRGTETRSNLHEREPGRRGGTE